ncbi:MAG: hypothetical protein ABJD13_03905 [Paracoccaceae bacterium]
MSSSIIRVLRIAIFFCFLGFTVSAQGKTALEIEFDRTFSVLKPVWDDDIVAAALGVYPDIDVELMRSMDFVKSQNPCQLRITIDPQAQSFIVPVSLNYFTFSLMNVQPSYLFLMGVSEFSDVDAVFATTRNDVGEQVRQFYKQACIRRDRSGFQIINPSSNFVSNSRYAEILGDLNQDTSAREKADEIAGLAILFVLLHEYGHVHLDHDTDTYSDQLENDADNFAATIFQEAGLPAYFGVYGLMLYEGLVLNRNRDFLNCRMASLAERQVTAPSASFFVQNNGSQQRLEMLRGSIIRQISASC